MGKRVVEKRVMKVCRKKGKKGGGGKCEEEKGMEKCGREKELPVLH